MLRSRSSIPELSPRPLPPFLEDLCLRCLSKDKAQRPASILEVGELLERAARPAPNPGFTPTRVPGPQERRRARLALAARRTCAWLAAAALLTGAFLALPDRASRSTPAIEARDVERRLADFQPDRAFSLVELLSSEDPARQRDLREEARRMLALREAMESCLPIRLDALHLKTATLRGVALSRGHDGLLCASGPEGREAILAWSDLEPSQIISLAGTTGAAEDPEIRFALALYCRRIGRPLDARTLLDSLQAASGKAVGVRGARPVAAH